MIVKNALGGVDRHNKTGRPLNKFNRVYSDKNPNAKIQKPAEDLFFGKVTVSIYSIEKAFNLADKMTKDYKLNNKDFSNKRIDLFKKFMLWCLLNIGETLQVKPIARLVSKDMLRFLLEDLEKLGMIEIYDGFKINGTSNKFITVPRAIKPSDKLVKLMIRES